MTATLFILTGCGTSMVRSDAENEARRMQIEPTLYSVSIEEAKDRAMPIRLPQNYDPSNYKLIRLGVNFYPLDENGNNRFAKNNAEIVSTLMETEIAKLKRFTVLSRHQLGQQALRDEKRFQDKTGISKNRMRVAQGAGADYVLTAGVALKTEKYDRVQNSEMFIVITVPYQLINVNTGEIVESGTAEGRAVRTFYQLPNGTYVGGFNIHNQADAEQAVNEASFRALKVIANMLGNKLPVGGRITGFKGKRFALECGHQQGLMGKQVAAVYAKDMGIDIPLGYAEIEPGKKTSTGRIIRWSREDEAEDLIELIEKDGMAFLRDYEVYAVSVAMPEPPEWEKNYKN